MKTFSKLVRDKIPEFFPPDEWRGYRVLCPEMKKYALLDKLAEEAKEVQEHHSPLNLIEELADVQTVMAEIMLAHGISPNEVAVVAKQKLEKYGGFSKGYYLQALELD